MTTPHARGHRDRNEAAATLPVYTDSHRPHRNQRPRHTGRSQSLAPLVTHLSSVEPSTAVPCSALLHDSHCSTDQTRRRNYLAISRSSQQQHSAAWWNSLLHTLGASISRLVCFFRLVTPFELATCAPRLTQHNVQSNTSSNTTDGTNLSGESLK